MRFRIVFGDGFLTGDTDEPSEIAVVEGARAAYERGAHWLPVGLEHDRTRTVGDIRSIEIDGVKVAS